MFFKNLHLYRLPDDFRVTADQLSRLLETQCLTPCNAMSLSSKGWIPQPHHPGFVHVAANGQWLITLCHEEKVLPAAVVKQETARLAKIQAELQGGRLTKRQLKELSDQAMQLLLPRAFIKRRFTHAWLDTRNGWLCVDASTQKRADELIEALYDADFGVTILRPHFNRSPESVMQQWLLEGEGTDGFDIDAGCELRSMMESEGGSPTVRYAHHSLADSSVVQHLQRGKLPVSLDLCFENRLTFTLTTDGEIKKLKLLDVADESALETEDGEPDEAAIFNADFFRMTGELQRLTAALVNALGGEIQITEGTAF